ncbi:MAG: SpoIIE family protein phosphatase [Phycisphaeraceae bacterium]|nr:SpoIIE family protein phosphatase [Phycisphaeraceae bacterium]
MGYQPLADSDPPYAQTLMGSPGASHGFGGHAAGQGQARPGDGPITLDPLVGPVLAPIEIDPRKPTTLGRSSTCEAKLADEAVSRRHASIAFRDGVWFITDLGSTHGTYVNNSRLEAEGMSPLRAGDMVRVGPWTFRVRMGPASHASSSLVDEISPASRQRVERVEERELAAISQTRLNLLMECAAAVVGVEDERALAQVVLRAAIEGSGFARAALLRDAPAMGDVEVVMDIDAFAKPGQSGTFSKSLISEARKGEMVKLVVEEGGGASASIMMLRIQTALCAPIKVGDDVTGFLYLDARQGEQKSKPGSGIHLRASGGVPQDAATFVQAVARMCALAMGNLSRVQLERRQVELLRDLSAAREAQVMIMPPETAEVGGVRYAMRMKSGRYVAGDLFDVVILDAHRTAIFLGDVAGKGISAAILMATAQTYLNAALKHSGDPALAVRLANEHICAHAASNKFISLWLGVFDSRSRTVTHVDAGHGHWLVARSGGRAERNSTSGGIPLGIDADFEYASETLELATGDRLVVFSDGVVEQPGPEGDMFQIDRAIAALEPSRTVDTDAAFLFDSVLAFAKTDSLADDTTVASVAFM